MPRENAPYVIAGKSGVIEPGWIEGPDGRWYDTNSATDRALYQDALKKAPARELSGEQKGERQEDVSSRIGLPTTAGASSLQTILQSAGVDLDSPEVQLYIQSTQAALEAGAVEPSLVQLQASALAARYPSAAQTQYTQALELSGFGDSPFPAGTQSFIGPPQLRGETGGVVTTVDQPNYEMQEETGWIRFKNGVLVDPSTGSVVFEPTSKAPGSPTWAREVVGNWGSEKIREWRQRLVQFGYLPKEAGKAGEVDVNFINAISSYHKNRYLNGGKPISGDATAGAAGADRPKIVNLEDFSHQIRNDVRDQYERIYGVRPSDGEVELWSDYIIRHGMNLQRKFARKYDSAMTDTAASEAEEMFIEKIENSPSARFLRESEEENTRLRETFDRMAQVTASLAS